MFPDLAIAVLRKVDRGVRMLFAPTASADVWRPPSRKMVADYAGRQAVAVLLVGAAALLCWRAGIAGQALPLAVIAASRVPDLFVGLLALVDADRRAGLRPRRRPGTLATVLAGALAVGAVVSAVTGSVPAEWLAALAACTGLAVSALPTQLVYPSSGQRPRAAAPPQTGTSSTAPTA